MSYSDDKDLIIKNKHPKLKFSPKKQKNKKKNSFLYLVLYDLFL